MVLYDISDHELPLSRRRLPKLHKKPQEAISEKEVEVFLNRNGFAYKDRHGFAHSGHWNIYPVVISKVIKLFVTDTHLVLE